MKQSVRDVCLKVKFDRLGSFWTGAYQVITPVLLVNFHHVFMGLPKSVGHLRFQDPEPYEIPGPRICVVDLGPYKDHSI